MRKLMTVVKCVAALAAGMFMFGANAGTQLYPASGTQDYGEVSSDINQKVDLPNTVSVSGAYVRCTFEGFATKPCRLQGLKPYFGGAECKTVGSTWDVIYPGTTAAAHEHYFLVYPGADQIHFKIQSMTTVNGFKAELATEAEAKAWSDAVWAEMNVDDPIANDGSKILDNVLKDFPIPDDPFAKLPKLKAALTNGAPFTIHFLGDSIAQDTYFSLITAQLRAKFPKADLRFTLYEEGSTGCSVFANKLSTAIPYTPDLLIICGLDNFRGTGYTDDATAAAALKTVIEYAKGLGSEVLYMTPAHSADSRLLQNSNLLYSENGTGWGAPWGNSCTPAVFNPANNDFWTSECYHPTARNAVLEEEDVPLWDIYPQCYDFVERSGRPWGWFNRDALHNNERGRALIAHLLMTYFDKAGVEGEGEGGEGEGEDDPGEDPVAPVNLLTVVDGDGTPVAPVRVTGDDTVGGELCYVFTDTTKTYTLTPSADMAVELLVVAGGGAGGGTAQGNPGGGGAGGLIHYDSYNLTAETGYTITVGAGGAADGSNGKDSEFGAIKAKGGGGGAHLGWGKKNGTSGGSGGGAGYETGYKGGAGTDGQGFAGGSTTAKQSTNSAGGGGAGGPAPNVCALTPHGDGGPGLSFDITGTPVWYAAGGGGKGSSRATAYGSVAGGTAGVNGTGGGGGGGAAGGSGTVIVRFSDFTGAKPQIRAADVIVTGAHGADVELNVSSLGAGAASATAGFSYWKTDGDKSDLATVTLDSLPTYGIASAAVTGLEKETDYSWSIQIENNQGEISETVAGTFTTPDEPKPYELLATVVDGDGNAVVPTRVSGNAIDGGEVYYRFADTTKTYTFTPKADMNVELLVVAGGGAGGSNPKGPGGGGGAGGLIHYDSYALTAGTSYAIKVGAGGLPDVSQSVATNNGKDSIFDTLIAVGGGGGGGNDWGNRNGNSGGSGGGPQYNEGKVGGAGTPGQGFAGGNVVKKVSETGPGGGGAGGVAPDLTADNIFGDGGPGLSFDITGSNVWYAAGGGGAGKYAGRATKFGSVAGNTAGADGLGGGGGGHARGGSGVVIIRMTDWTSAKPLLTDPAVTVKGSRNVEVSGVVSAFGTDASSASAKFEYWLKDGDKSDLVATTLVENLGREAFAVKVLGLTGNTEYAYRLYLTNSAGVDSDVVTGTFTTFSPSLAAAATGEYETSEPDESDTLVVFTGNGTFTPTGSGAARVLVVAGGGSGGGWCGGGGGGGVLYTGDFFFDAGVEYSITVGAGGRARTSWTQGEKGGNSFIAMSDGEGGQVKVLEAIGGGGGGNANNGGYSFANMCGGSGGGGGGQNSGFAGNGTDGQGTIGGLTLNGSYAAGGGGGAGGAGGMGTIATHGGDGGPGILYDITGEPVYYGAGGGGGTCSMADGTRAGLGGLGGGGAGQFNQGASGEDATGYGCGGGGKGNGAGNYTGTSGAGSKGVVIIRYTDYEKAEKNHTPKLSVSPVQNATANSAEVSVNVSFAGGTASAVKLYACFGTTEGVYTTTNLVDSAFIGAETVTVTGLSPNRTYYVAILADNELVDEDGQKDGIAFAPAGSISTPSAFNDIKIAVTGTGLSYTFSCTLAAMNAAVEGETSTLELCVTYGSADPVKVGEVTPTAVGTQSIAWDIPAASAYDSFKYQIVYRGTDGVNEWTSETGSFTMTPSDGITYTWKSDVTDGEWTDPNCWTPSTAGGAGFPIGGSSADLREISCATVHVDRAVTIGGLRIAKNGGRLVLWGEGEGASLKNTSNGNYSGLGSGQTLVLHNIDFTHKTTTWGAEGADIILEDGATFGNAFTVADGKTLSVSSGSSYTGALTVKAGAKVVVDGGTLVPSSLAVNGNATLTLTAPLEGFETAPIAVGGAVTRANDGVLSIAIPKTSPLRKQTKKADMPILTATSVASGAVWSGKLLTIPSKFFLKDGETEFADYAAASAASATVKGVWLHYAPPTGLAIILR